jgi:hypothetical protein
MKDKKKIAEIVNRLPDNLSEEAVKEICKVIDEIIAEEVKSGFKILTAKVNGFLRTQIDSIKEQALSELSEESELYRNAQMFEEVKNMLALETSAKDTNKAAQRAVSESKEEVSEVTKDNKFLIKQLNEAAKMVAELEIQNKKLKKKARISEARHAELSETITELTESNKLEVKATDKGIMFTEENSPVRRETDNPFLTEDVMALFRQAKVK